MEGDAADFEWPSSCLNRSAASLASSSVNALAGISRARDAASPDQSGVKSLLPCCSALARNGSSSANGSGKSAAASDSGPSSRQAAAFV